MRMRHGAKKKEKTGGGATKRPEDRETRKRVSGGTRRRWLRCRLKCKPSATEPPKTVDAMTSNASSRSRADRCRCSR